MRNKKALSTCGCKGKKLTHVKVFWENISEEFNYCNDCIKSDCENGMIFEIM